MGRTDAKRPEGTTAESVYHVVCRDCEFERVATDDEAAERRTTTHADDADHTVVYARID